MQCAPLQQSTDDLLEKKLNYLLIDTTRSAVGYSGKSSRKVQPLLLTGVKKSPQRPPLVHVVSGQVIKLFDEADTTAASIFSKGASYSLADFIDEESIVYTRQVTFVTVT